MPKIHQICPPASTMRLGMIEMDQAGVYDKQTMPETSLYLSR